MPTILRPYPLAPSRSRRRNPDPTVEPVDFETRSGVCDRCHRPVTGGLVVMSNGQRVGRDCAATMMGMKKPDAALKRKVDGLERARQRGNYENLRAADAGEFVLSQNVFDIADARGNRDATTRAWFDGHYVWTVSDWGDGLLVAEVVQAPRLTLGVDGGVLARVLGAENVYPPLLAARGRTPLPGWKLRKKPLNLFDPKMMPAPLPPPFALRDDHKMDVDETEIYYRVSDLPVLDALVEQYRVRKNTRRRNPDDAPLRPVGFDPQNHECDRCHRIVFDGLVIMSNGMRVGRDCAATMMGRKKSDKEYKAQVEELEVAALQQRYAENAVGAVPVLSENVLGIEERGRRAAPTTPYWHDGYFTWLVEEWADGTKLAYMVNPFRLEVRQSALKRVLGEHNVVPFSLGLHYDPVALPEWMSVKKFWKKPPPVYAMNLRHRLYRVEDLPVLAALVERYRVRPEAPKANPRRSRR